jgi:hypothetical protein
MPIHHSTRQKLVVTVHALMNRLFTWAAFIVAMDSEWETVPGEWTFEIWSQEEKLAGKTFFVKER